MNYKKSALCYLAGYLDGDGCFHISLSKKRRDRASIKITSTSEKNLLHFKKTFGGSVSLAQKAHDNSKDLWQYSIGKRSVLSFVTKLHPLLVEKQKECKIMIDFMKDQSLEERSALIEKMQKTKSSEGLVCQSHIEEFNSLKNTIKPTTNDFAYLAGFIDAECSLGIQRYKVKNKPNYLYKVLLQCNNSKYPVFKWLIQKFGGFVSFVNKSKCSKSRRNQITWRLSAKALSRILPCIKPFLLHKKPVCEELIKFYNTTLPNGGDRQSENFRDAYSEIVKRKEEIVKNVHKLNLKGVSNFNSL